MTELYSYTYMSLDGVMSSPEKWTSPYFSEEMGLDLAPAWHGDRCSTSSSGPRRPVRTVLGSAGSPRTTRVL